MSRGLSPLDVLVDLLGSEYFDHEILDPLGFRWTNFGVGALGDMLKAHADRAPLHRNVDQLEVGGTALYLASDLSSAVTGEVIYVDCGYNIMGF